MFIHVSILQSPSDTLVGRCIHSQTAAVSFRRVYLISLAYLTRESCEPILISSKLNENAVKDDPNVCYKTGADLVSRDKPPSMPNMCKDKYTVPINASNNLNVHLRDRGVRRNGRHAS